LVASGTCDEDESLREMAFLAWLKVGLGTSKKAEKVLSSLSFQPEIQTSSVEWQCQYGLGAFLGFPISR
jgi:hypothetical protein